MVKFLSGKPTEEEILSVKDFRDDGYKEAMRHGSQILGYESEYENSYRIGINKSSSRKRKK